MKVLLSTIILTPLSFALYHGCNGFASADLEWDIQTASDITNNYKFGICCFCTKHTARYSGFLHRLNSLPQYSETPLSEIDSLSKEGPDGSMSLVVGSSNSYQPITNGNTVWVRARLCKLQKHVHSTRSHM